MFKKLAILALIGTVSSITLTTDVSVADQSALDAVTEEEETAAVQTMVDTFEEMGIDLDENADEAESEDKKKLSVRQKKKFDNIMKKLDKDGNGNVDYDEGEDAYVKICVKKLGIPMEKLNPKGGAIALGHPLGMTGSRMIVTLMTELERTQKRFGIVSMCIGTGMGAAGVFERE